MSRWEVAELRRGVGMERRRDRDELLGQGIEDDGIGGADRCRV